MKWLRTAVDWIRRYPWAVLVAIGGIVGAIVLLRSQRNQLVSLDDAIMVQATRRKIASREKRLKAILSGVQSKDLEIAELDEQIANSKRHVVEIHEDRKLEGVSDEVIADIFGGVFD